MKTITLPSLTLLCVDVPEEHNAFELWHGMIFIGVEKPSIRWITIPRGTYKILGRLDELTEEVAKGIVENEIQSAEQNTGFIDSVSYKCYIYDCFDLNTALESLHSILKANNIEGNPILLIDKH